MALPETGGTPEYKIGDEIPVLEHNCIGVGKIGIIIEMKGRVPVTARCLKCSGKVAVDFRAIAELGKSTNTPK